MESKNPENEQLNCVICGDGIEYYSIGICNHKEICYYCTLKNRTFYNDKKCPLCNTQLDIVFIAPKEETRTFNELSKEDLSSFYQDNDFKKTNIYYTDISSYQISMQLKSFKCPIDYCTKEEPFDTYEDLLQHLYENHQKFYCKVCVKDGKKFISEQKVFSKSEIKEHNLYGDFEEDIPPHHKCPFCGELYYDDEILYKHMSSSYFMCEICKKIDKKIIFYSALPNLIQHNKLYHYCCPFKECKEILYIAFPNKKQLIQHFENKHNQKNNNLNEKMANENLPGIIKDPTLFDISLKKDEFNFNEFLEKVNKRCIQHRENKNKTNNEEEDKDTKDNNNQNNSNNMNGIEIIYTDQPKYEKANGYYRDENYYYKRGRGRWRGRGKKIKRDYNYLIKQTFNDYVEPEENNDNQIKIKELDYEFLTNFFIELLKKYIINYIKKNKISENEVSLPKETQYQLIMVIDKINDNKQILELYNIQNFGIDWDKIIILKDYLVQGDQVIESELFNILDTLTFKNILVLYKYLLIANKKISRSFYKLDIEQINDNLYTNFFPNSKKSDNKLNGRNGYASFSLNQNLNKINLNRNNNEKKNKKNKNKWNQVEIIGLNNDKKNKKSKQNKEKEINKNQIYKNEDKKEELNNKIEENKINNDKKDNSKINKKIQNKSNLAILINSNNNKQNSKKPKITGEFKLSNFNYDEDFPPLK